MDFNTVNTTKVATQPAFKNNPPPEVEAPKEKKKPESPAIASLSTLIGKAQTDKKTPEQEVKEQLDSIGSELDGIEAYVNEINSQGEISVEEAGKILGVLKGLQAKLDDLERQIQDLAAKYKLDDKAAAEQMGRLSQVDILRKQIEDQRNQDRLNSKSGEFQTPVAQEATPAPSAPPATVINQATPSAV